MALSTDSLIVRIGSDTKGLDRGVDRSKRMLKSLGSAASVAAKSLGLITAAAGVAAIALGTKLTKEGLRSVDAMNKLARSLGSSQAEMSALTRAAELAGIQQSLLERSVQAFNKRLGESIQGTGEAKDALEAMGLKAEELIDLPLSEQLAIVGDKINQFGSSAEKAALLSDLFSRSGLAMFNLFEGGGEAIRAARDEVERLGIAVSAVDARQVEAANDAMSRMGLILKGVGNQLAVRVAPFLIEVSNRMADASGATRGFGDHIQVALETAIRWGARFVDMWRFIPISIKEAEMIAAEFQRAWQVSLFFVADKMSIFVDGFTGFINTIIKGFNALPGPDKELLPFFKDTEMFKELEQGASEAMAEVARLRKEILELENAPLASEGIDEFIEAVKQRALEAAQELEKRQKELSGGLGIVSQDEEMLAKDLENRLEVIRKGLLTEREAEIEHFEMSAATLLEALELKKITQLDFNEQIERLTEEHQRRMTEIENKGLTEREKFEKASLAARAKTITSHLTQMTQTVTDQSRALFNVNKAAAIAQAIIDAYQGIQKTWNAYPYPWNIPMAAAHAVTAFANIQKIKSSTFATGTAAPSVAAVTPVGSTPVNEVSNGIAGNGGSPGQTVNIALQGDRFGVEQVQELIEQINEAVADGAVIRVT